MDEPVPLNFFQFLPLDAEHVARCPHGDAPGVFILVQRSAPLQWAYVGTAEGDLKSRLTKLLEDPGHLRALVEHGALFATSVVRSPAARQAARAFLIHELQPIDGSRVPGLLAGFDCSVRFYGSPADRPIYFPKRRSPGS